MTNKIRNVKKISQFDSRGFFTFSHFRLSAFLFLFFLL